MDIPTQIANPAAHVNAKARALALMDPILRPGSAVAPEFPLVFGADARGWVVVSESDGEDASACAGVVRELVAGPERVACAFLGSVVTAEAHRGRGLARHTLATAEDRARNEGAALAFLWADEAEVYAGMGWRPAGTEFDFRLDDNQRTFLPDAEGVRVARAEDAEAIHALYCEHEQRVERTLDEQRQLLAVPGVTTLVREVDGKVTAYGCVGRGADLQGVLHEWGGEGVEVLHVLAGHLDLRDDEGLDEDLFLMLPSGATGLLEYLSLTRCPGAKGVLGLAKVLCLEGAAELLRGHLPSSVEASVEGATVALRRGGKGISLDADALLDLLLPPAGEGRIQRKVERRLGVNLASLPLAPFIWGLDSI